MKKRGRGFAFQIAVPKDLRQQYNGRTVIQSGLGTRDEDIAQAAALELAGIYKKEFVDLRKKPDQSRMSVREIYQKAREGFKRHIEETDTSRLEELTDIFTGQEADLEARAEKQGIGVDDPLTPELQAEVDALSDSRKEFLEDEEAKPREEYEPPFKDVADEWIKDWKKGREKKTNTSVQYESTIRMFASFWGDKTIRKIRQQDAAEFFDKLRHISGTYKSNPDIKTMTFSEIHKMYGGKGNPLSPPTVNRHMNVLFTVWKWAKMRGKASGDNPFEGLRLKDKRTRKEHFIAFTNDELEALLSPPPKKKALHEIFLVGMYSGMRINEIASLTWGQLKQDGKIWYFDIGEAKTKAGRRVVPVHSKLSWLLDKKRHKPTDQIWPQFKPKGPGEKPGEHASRFFGNHKRSRGIVGRQKSFHSLRSNVTTQLENKGVPLNEWQDIFGHEKSFTYATYSHGLTLQRKAEIVELIDYGDLSTTP